MSAISTATGVNITALTSLSSSVISANSFNATVYQNNITSATNNVLTTINNFVIG